MRVISSRVFRAAVALCALCLRVPWVHAETVAGLHEAEVPIAAQDAAARSAAAAAALAEVFVKTSGSRRALDNPVVAGALREADRLLAQFYFSRIAYPPRSAGPAEELGLHAVFSPPAIANLLRRAGEPLLPPNRPATLLWIAIDDGTGGGARLFDRDADAALADWLRWHGGRRGMPLRFPEMDLQDSTTVAAEQVWQLDAPALLAGSERYGPGPVLLAKLAATGDGGWVGQWVYRDGEQASDGEANAPAIEVLAGELVDFAAEGVAARYAVHAAAEQGEQLRLRVDGLAAFPHYHRAYRLLQGMTSVRQVQLVLVDRDTFFFDLVTASDAETVLRELSLLPGLQPVGEAAALHYRWSGG